MLLFDGPFITALRPFLGSPRELVRVVGAQLRLQVARWWRLPLPRPSPLYDAHLRGPPSGRTSWRHRRHEEPQTSTKNAPETTKGPPWRHSTRTRRAPHEDVSPSGFILSASLNGVPWPHNSSNLHQHARLRCGSVAGHRSYGATAKLRTPLVIDSKQ